MKIKTVDIALGGMIASLVFLLGMTPVGIIPLGFINLTITHIPVIAATLLLGWKKGLLFGAAFGLASTLSAFGLSMTSPSALAQLVLSYSPLALILMSMLPRLMIPIVTHLCYKTVTRITTARKLKRGKIISVSVAAIIGSLTNTLLYLGLMGVFLSMSGNYGAYATGIFKFIIVVAASCEAIAAALISCPIVLTLSGVAVNELEHHDVQEREASTVMQFSVHEYGKARKVGSVTSDAKPAEPQNTKECEADIAESAVLSEIIADSQVAENAPMQAEAPVAAERPAAQQNAVSKEVLAFIPKSPDAPRPSSFMRPTNIEPPLISTLPNANVDKKRNDDSPVFIKVALSQAAIDKKLAEAAARKEAAEAAAREEQLAATRELIPKLPVQKTYIEPPTFVMAQEYSQKPQTPAPKPTVTQPAPVQYTPTVKPAPVQPAPTFEVKPAPVQSAPTFEVKPAPVQSAPTFEVKPAPVQSAPTFEVKPAPVQSAPTFEVKPAPVQSAPTFEVKPAPVQSAPTFEVKPAPVQSAPVVKNNDTPEFLMSPAYALKQGATAAQSVSMSDAKEVEPPIVAAVFSEKTNAITEKQAVSSVKAVPHDGERQRRSGVRRVEDESAQVKQAEQAKPKGVFSRAAVTYDEDGVEETLTNIAVMPPTEALLPRMGDLARSAHDKCMRYISPRVSSDLHKLAYDMLVQFVQQFDSPSDKASAGLYVTMRLIEAAEYKMAANYLSCYLREGYSSAEYGEVGAVVLNGALRIVYAVAKGNAVLRADEMRQAERMYDKVLDYLNKGNSILAAQMFDLFITTLSLS